MKSPTDPTQSKIENRKSKIEICAANLGSAIAANEAGADRIELCSALAVGGLTPSAGLILTAKKALTIPVFPLIRVREGDFCYSKMEVKAMCRDILFCKKSGCEGIVIGALKKNGRLNEAVLKRLIAAAAPLEIVLHRAFDFTRDPFEALETAVDLGFKRILTSGQKPTAWEGKSLIIKLLARADGRISIMPGSGISDQNIAQLAVETGATDFHFSASGPHGSAFFQTKTTLGGLDFDRQESDPSMIRRARIALAEIGR